ncbi:amidohydrolase family protein [Streptomyces plumbiresistens]|uniref:Amidohydrolase family protein n=1 Tax=Streptomyces plumbiresistens TaxID=511811 RepID=A0ABP7SJV1_9ACTN
MNSLEAVAGPFRRVMFDAVNHYCEPEAAFFRYLDPVMSSSLRARHELAANIRPGAGQPPFLAFGGTVGGTSNGWPVSRNGVPTAARRAGAVPASHWSREARMDLMNAQGIERAWFFPMVATTWEDRLRADPEYCARLFAAFNRWLEEDWGFAYQDRIFAAPYISLADPTHAVDMLKWCLTHDARVVMIRPTAAWTRHGVLSPTSPQFDGLWGLAQESGVTVAVHAGEAGYMRHGYATVDVPHGTPDSEQLIWSYLHEERPIFDFLAAALIDRLFERFPGLRLASVENGSRFLPHLISKVTTVRDNHASRFSEDPIDLLRQHVWVVPHWHDDINEVVELLGAGHVLFGSGWPLPGGPDSPSDYVGELAHLPSDEQTAILHGNADLLNQRMPRWAVLGHQHSTAT